MTTTQAYQIGESDPTATPPYQIGESVYTVTQASQIDQTQTSLPSELFQQSLRPTRLLKLSLSKTLRPARLYEPLVQKNP